MHRPDRTSYLEAGWVGGRILILLLSKLRPSWLNYTSFPSLPGSVLTPSMHGKKNKSLLPNPVL